MRRLFGAPQEVVVLMYHSVGQEDWEFTVTPENFEKQIRYLKNRGYLFWDFRELKEFLTGRRNSIRQAVVVTFDDGYRDFVTNALPILRRYQIPALLLIHTDRSSYELGNQYPLMSWDDIKKVASQGVKIGCHSHSHPNMKQLSDEQLRQELEESAQMFREHLGFAPTLFAYPGGKFNASVIQMLKESGYTLGFTIDRGLVHKGDNPFTLKRNGISAHTSLLEFKVRTSHAGEWYEHIVQLLKL